MSRSVAVLGLGSTGLSCIRFLIHQGCSVTVFDTRQNPPGLERCRHEFPEVTIHLGTLDEYISLLMEFDERVVSPGLSIQETPFVQLQKAGYSLIGDIELFVRQARAPIVAITGSNAKSTVTTLVADMARADGMVVAVGGNLGEPALDLLNDQVQLYVLELSSFQLETTHSLSAQVATVLNLSEDHLDRYASMQAYQEAKQRIYRNAKSAVFNRQDSATVAQLPQDIPVRSFGADVPDMGQWGLREELGRTVLACGLQPVLAMDELRILGGHNALNALAALAIGTLAGISLGAMQSVLRTFNGLAHRCQMVRAVHGVVYYDDSKGTNVGATVAAIEGMAIAGHRKVVLILGGIAKGQNFAPLVEPVRRYVGAVVLMGVDADRIAAVLPSEVSVHRVHTMEVAVSTSCRLAQPGDAVLLSPACSSFDMFRDYHDRGNQFVQAVEALV